MAPPDRHPYTSIFPLEFPLGISYLAVMTTFKRRMLLVALFVALHLAAVDADRFVVTEHATESANSSDVEHVNFVKYITIGESPVDQGVFVSMLSFMIPGRVFVDYVDYKDGGDLVNSSTLALIKVSEDQFDVVNQTRAASYIEDYDTPPGLVYLTMDDTEFDEPLVTAAVPTTGHLLVEVSVFHANAIMWLAAASPTYDSTLLEVVATDSVVYLREDSPQFSSDSSGYLNYTGGSGVFWEGDDSFYITTKNVATIYVVSTVTPLNLHELSVTASERSNVYVEGSSLAASTDASVALQNDTSFIAVFDTIKTESLLLSPGESGKICFAVSDSLALGRDSSVNDTQNVALPDETGGIAASGSFTCGKMEIPDRVPRDISLLSTSFTPSSGAGSGESLPLASSGNDGSPSFPLVGALVSLASAVVVVELL